MPQTDYTGDATSTTLVGTLPASSGAGTVMTVANGSGWPTGATGIPFVGTLGRGTSTEEKVLFSSRNGNNFTIQQRGYDDTVAVTHQNNESVNHTNDATLLRTASAHIFDTTRNDHPQYALLAGANRFTNADNYFGDNAAGGAGTRLHLIGGATVSYVKAEGTPTDVALVLSPQGAGSLIVQRDDGLLNFLQITKDSNVILGNGVGNVTGDDALFMSNVGVAPSGNPTTGGVIYVQGGALKYRGSSGTVTTLAVA